MIQNLKVSLKSLSSLLEEDYTQPNFEKKVLSSFCNLYDSYQEGEDHVLDEESQILILNIEQNLSIIDSVLMGYFREFWASSKDEDIDEDYLHIQNKLLSTAKLLASWFEEEESRNSLEKLVANYTDEIEKRL